MIKIEITIKQDGDDPRAVKMNILAENQVATGGEANLADAVCGALKDFTVPGADRVNYNEESSRKTITLNEALDILAEKFDNGEFTDEEYLSEITRMTSASSGKAPAQ